MGGAEGEGGAFPGSPRVLWGGCGFRGFRGRLGFRVRVSRVWCVFGWFQGLGFGVFGGVF